MEEQNVQTQESSNNILDATVGNNEGSQALEHKEVEIVDVIIQTHNKDNKKMNNELVQIHCKHPDKDDPIKLTQVKRVNGDKMINTSLFVARDDDGKFMKDSGIATLLHFKQVSTLTALKGLKIDTVKESETSKYMALKCY